MRWILVVTALIALTLAVFALWPGVDLIVAHVFYDRGGFIGHDGLERFGRDFFRVAPFVVLAAYIALYALRRAGVAVVWAPTGLGVIFLIATLAIGPGLIVNLGFKDHAHRPRPVHVVDFGGPDEFRPWYRFDGALQGELLVRFRRSGVGILDGRAGARRAAAVARARRWRARSPSASPRACSDGVRRPFSLRRAARRADRAVVVLVARRLLWPKGGP